MCIAKIEIKFIYHSFNLRVNFSISIVVELENELLEECPHLYTFVWKLKIEGGESSKSDIHAFAW